MIDTEGQLRKIQDGLYFSAGVAEQTDVNNVVLYELSGRGNDFFEGYYIWVIWDGGGAGAAPQGERRLITGYVSATGVFTHDAFTAALAAGDRVLVVHSCIALGDLMGPTYDLATGQLVQVPFYNEIDTIQNDEVILFEFDATGATIRDIFISFYLPLHATATFTPTWRKTRPGDLVTFTTELIPAIGVIATPAASNYYSYNLGELAQGLQGRFYLAMSNHAGVVTVDANAVAKMVL